MNFNSWPDDIVTSIYVDEELHLFDLTPNTQNEGRYLGVQLFIKKQIRYNGLCTTPWPIVMRNNFV